MNQKPSLNRPFQCGPGHRILQWLFCLFIGGLLLPSGANGQINSWTNSTSANWHDLRWSLGVRPSSSQAAVYITNAYWKAVQIGAETASIYPASLTVSNLFLGAADGYYNTLLLNYSGTTTPLRVVNQLTVGSNSTLRMLASRLEIGKQLLVENVVSQEDGAQATVGQLLVGPGSGAIYNLSSGLASAGLEEIGGTNYSQALFFHGGGTNQTTTLRVHAKAEYQLNAGSLRAGSLIVGDVPTMFLPSELAGSFTQSGGQLVVSNDLRVGEGGQGSGRFVMSGGSVSSDALRVGTMYSGTGHFQQLGGTNQCRLFVLSEGDDNPWVLPDPYTYSGFLLGNGRLVTGQSQHGAGRPCYFNQTGGVYEVSTSLNISAGQDSRSYYSLAGGITRCQSMSIDSSEFYHSAGTNHVATQLQIQGRSIYQLSGGTLLTGNTSIQRLGFDDFFLQSGGLHLATNSLSIGYSPTNFHTGDRYIMTGGQLTTPGILLWGQFEHRGGALTPTSMAMYGGRWIAGVPYQEFHQLDPRGDARTISSIVMATNPCILRFDYSLTASWLGTLSIEHWSGSPNGGGTQQIRFGTDGNGLGSYHLMHTWFVDPTGFEPGLYQAKILNTGELVPGRKSKFSLNRLAGRLVLSWDTPTFLLSATNIAGPYYPVPGASYSFTNTFTDPIRFFRLGW